MPANAGLHKDVRRAPAARVLLDSRMTRADGAPIISFNHGDPRSRTDSAETCPEIDFIDVRQGSLPGPLTSLTDGEVDHWVTPFQWTEWLQSWQRHMAIRTRSIPVTAIGYSNGQAVFALPLAVMTRYGARYLTWCAYQQSDYCAPILGALHAGMVSQLNAESMLRQIADKLGGIDLIYLPKQPATIAGFANPFVLEDSVPYHAGAHAINFTPGDSWEQSLARRRSSKTRKRLKEKRAALEKLGKITFRMAETEADALALIENCLAAKSEQLARLGHWDPFSPPGVRSFLSDYFSSNIRQTTWAATLELDGKPAATAIGFRGKDEWLLYQMAMSSGIETKYSPGTHLLMSLMQTCIERGVKRLDLGLGDESYKAEWCDEDISLWISTLALTMRGQLLQKLVRLRSKVRARLAADPALYAKARWAKGMAKKLRLPV